MIKELFDKEYLKAGRYDEYEMLEFLVNRGGINVQFMELERAGGS